MSSRFTTTLALVLFCSLAVQSQAQEGNTPARRVAHVSEQDRSIQGAHPSLEPSSDSTAERLASTTLVEEELAGQLSRSASQLRFCYQEYGLKMNPDLHGDLSLELALARDGHVAGVRVRGRTWEGPGASEAEQCVKQRLLAWRLPPTEAPGRYRVRVTFSGG